MSTSRSSLKVAVFAVVLTALGSASSAAQQDSRGDGAVNPGPRTQANEDRLSPSDIAELYSASVVQILAEVGDAGVKQGTGFPLAEDGLFATSLHLIDGATRVWVRTASGDKHELEVIEAYDTAHDLVVLRVRAQGLSVPPLGDSRDLEIGEPVVVIGNPLGLTRSVTDGILSARRRPQESVEDDPLAPEWVVMPDCELLQISAPVAPGTSGAPVFDLAGRVVGIEMGGISEGALDLNFAIPVEALLPLVGRSGGLDLESLQMFIDDDRRAAASEFLENARLALELDDLLTAEKELHKALARFPRFMEALLLQSQLLLANGEHERAEEVLLEATQEAPYSVELWQALGEVYLATTENGSSLSRAEACFERVLDLEPGHTSATFGMGVVYLEQDRMDEAIEHLETAFRDDPDLSMAGFALGRAYMERHRFDDAAEIFDDILWEDPEFAPAHFGRALVAYLLDEQTEEATHWERFFELAEGDPRYAALFEEAIAFLRSTNSSLLPWRYQ